MNKEFLIKIQLKIFPTTGELIKYIAECLREELTKFPELHGNIHASQSYRSVHYLKVNKKEVTYVVSYLKKRSAINGDFFSEIEKEFQELRPDMDDYLIKQGY